MSHAFCCAPAIAANVATINGASAPLPKTSIGVSYVSANHGRGGGPAKLATLSVRIAFRLRGGHPRNILQRSSCRQCNALHVCELRLRATVSVGQCDELRSDLVTQYFESNHLARQRPPGNRALPYADRRRLSKQQTLENRRLGWSRENLDTRAGTASLHRHGSQRHIECAVLTNTVGDSRQIFRRHIVDVTYEFQKFVDCRVGRRLVC